MSARESTLSELIDQRRSWGEILQRLEMSDHHDVFDAVVSTGRAQFEMTSTVADAIGQIDVRLKEIEDGIIVHQTNSLELLRQIRMILMGLLVVGLVVLYKALS